MTTSLAVSTTNNNNNMITSSNIANTNTSATSKGSNTDNNITVLESSKQVTNNSSSAVCDMTNTVIKNLLTSNIYKDQIVHIEIYPSRIGQYQSLKYPLQSNTLSYAVHTTMNITQFYTHQAIGIDAIRQGRHVILSTSTASGKSLIYNIPILESILTNHDTTTNNTTSTTSNNNDVKALYLFPTKALSQDQLRVLNSLCSTINQKNIHTFNSTNNNDSNNNNSNNANNNTNSTQPQQMIEVEIFDGDTSYIDRQRVLASFKTNNNNNSSRRAKTNTKRGPSIIATNPDMLHTTILPNHTQWKHFLARLRFIVVDEAHMYNGIFGAHVACVIKRLIRLCCYYQQQLQNNNNTNSHSTYLDSKAFNTPQFIVCSATMKNPLQHFFNLVPIKHILLAQHQHRNINHDNNDSSSCNNSNNNEEETAIINKYVCIIDNTREGAPKVERSFVIWNPPLIANNTNTSTSHNMISNNSADIYATTCANGNMTMNTINDIAAADVQLITPPLTCPCTHINVTTTIPTPNSIIITTPEQQIKKKYDSITTTSTSTTSTTTTTTPTTTTILVPAPFSEFIKGCEDKVRTSGSPVKSYMTSYSGGWKRRKQEHSNNSNNKHSNCNGYNGGNTPSSHNTTQKEVILINTPAATTSNNNSSMAEKRYVDLPYISTSSTVQDAHIHTLAHAIHIPKDTAVIDTQVISGIHE